MSKGAHDINEVTNGTAVVHIRNLDLASCLTAVGVALRKDPPYTHVRLANGEDQFTFNFESRDSDGQFTTMELAEAFRQDMRFIDENPVHPFTFAMCALKNQRNLKRWMKNSTPYVGFKWRGGAVLYVIKGSRKHKNAIAKGLTQI